MPLCGDVPKETEVSTYVVMCQKPKLFGSSDVPSNPGAATQIVVELPGRMPCGGDIAVQRENRRECGEEHCVVGG